MCLMSESCHDSLCGWRHIIHRQREPLLDHSEGTGDNCNRCGLLVQEWHSGMERQKHSGGACSWPVIAWWGQAMFTVTSKGSVDRHHWAGI